MLHPDFKEFLELLNEHNVHYLVVGGYALNLYVAKPRNTGDLDIWIAISDENASKIKTVNRPQDIADVIALGDNS